MDIEGLRKSIKLWKNHKIVGSICIIVTIAIVPFVTSFFSEKGRQIATTASMQKTLFVRSELQIAKNPDGSFIYACKLMPRGSSIVPMLHVGCKTQNGAIIKSFYVSGATLPRFCMDTDNGIKDRTYLAHEYGAFYPGELFVTIVTDRDAGAIDITVDPEKRG
jgi:hypothetical protein